MSPEEALDIAQSLKQTEGAAGGGALTGGAGAGSAKGAAGPGSAAHKAERWANYQDRGGSWSYERWSKQYDVNMANPTRGLGREAVYREALGAENRILTTPFGQRQVDALVPESARAVQVKTGFESLTTTGRNANALAIRKDAWLVQQGYDVEWILEKGGSKPLLRALEAAGVRYHIGSVVR